jgi:signal transduction histidine kinase
VITLYDPFAGVRHPAALAMNLASLGALVYGMTTEAHLGLGGHHLAASLLLVAATAGWCGWVLGRTRDLPRLSLLSLTSIALAGGALTAFATLALIFVGVAALGATLEWDLSVAVWVVLAGPAAMAIALGVTGQTTTDLGGGAGAVVAGAAMGISRRQSLLAARRAAEIQVTEARADAERARAELLAGRNHMARELHDVLAHTLSALSLQLEALEATIDNGPSPSPKVLEQLELTKRLVRSGLDDARGAVRALREDAPPLEEQLVTLASDRGAALTISGAPRKLGPDVSLALYRVAQEGLTNVVKHAPGASAEVTLTYSEGQVCLSVFDLYPAGKPGRNRIPLSASGGGYGIQGIRERVLLLGGRVEAGPTDGGWAVSAEIPA